MELQQAATQPPPIAYFPAAELEQVRDFIYQVAGVHYPEQHFPLLLDRCQQRMSKLGSQSLAEYVQNLKSSSGQTNELKHLLSAIASTGTCFYENQGQLDALADVVLPRILMKRPANYLLRIWSAGCTGGEDPYSVAMFLLERSAELLNGRNFEIIATHPSPHTLAECNLGRYGSYALRNVSESMLSKYFQPADNGLHQVNDSVKEKIRFQATNLLDDSKLVFLKNIDVIFCRNVLGTFSLESKLHVLHHFHHNLTPHGCLFLGERETLFGVTDDLELVHFTKAIGYVKKQPTM